MSDPNPKSPRDWLLARHTRASPQLDALCRAALPTPEITWREFLVELFRPHRRVWQTLAIVWVGLLALHFTFQRPTPSILVSPPGPEAVAVWLAQLKSNETFAQIGHHP